MSAVISFLIVVFVGRLHELIPGTQYVKPVFLALGVGTIGQFMFYKPAPPGFRLFRLPFIFWCLFTLGVFISLPASLYPGRTADFLLYKYVSLALMLFMVCYNLTNFRNLEVTTLALVAVVIGLGTAMIVMPKRMIVETGLPRLSVGETFDSNDLALVMVMCIPILFYWFWRGGIFTKAIVVMATGLDLLAVYRTGSRGGLISLGFVALYMIFTIKELGMPIRILMVVAMLGGGVFIVNTPTFTQLLLGLQGKDYNADDDDGRLAIWKRGLGYTMERPLNGVGADCFEIAEEMLSGRKTVSRGVKYSTAHNSYIQVMAENGVIAVTIWFLMIVSAARLMKKQIKLFRPMSDYPEVHQFVMMCAMVRCSLLAFLLGGLFLSLGYLPLLYLMIAYSLALTNIGDRMVLGLEEEYYAEMERQGNGPLPPMSHA